MTAPAAQWSQAMRALAALATDPDGLAGLSVRARAGPVRRRFEQALTALPGPHHRLHPAEPDSRLFGGLDVVASLRDRQLRRDPGLAAAPGMLVLAMAERAPPGFAARLAQLMDRRAGHVLVLLDEGAEPDERAPACLRERLGFEVDLDAVPWRAAQSDGPTPDRIAAARNRLTGLRLTDDHAALLVGVAARFGIDSLRAPLLAQRAARALAAWDAADAITDDHLREAAELVYAPRATRLPDPPEDPPQDDPPPPGDPQDGRDGEAPDSLPDEMIVAAIAARLPPALLARLDQPGPARAPAGGSGAGARRKGNRRGRPLPSRPGRPDGRARIDLVATLRAAAPYQTLRRHRPGAGVIVLPSDIRLRRYEDRSDRLLIFSVDASGSSAMARMAEAKGAVELLLGRAYAQRDHVALIGFRGDRADLLLAPTRSLVQAKRQLAALPGGGGTPLAAGLRMAMQVAAAGRHHGLTPALILLTDGRGNIALDGTASRAEARQDSETLAALLRAQAIPAVVIDTSARPASEGADLAGWLGARYLALPRADAASLCDHAQAALAGHG